MGMKEGGRRVYKQSDTKREVVKEIGNLKSGKHQVCIDGITWELLRYGGEAVSEWMHVMCNLAYKEGRKSTSRLVKGSCSLVYKGKGDKSECCYYRGISLVSIPGNVFGEILIKRVQEIRKDKVSEEQGRFRTGKGCIDQTFNMRMVTEKVLAKGKNVCAAFMD